MFLGGRGTGKTRAGSEWVLDQIWTKGKRRVALVGRTPADVRDVMIHGEAGIMACSQEERRPLHEPTKTALVFPNGAVAMTYSAAAPNQLRGPEHDCAWADETAAWFDANKGDRLDTAWNNLMMGLRLGDDPRCLVTTTPKRLMLIRELVARATTAITRGTTYENLENLAPHFREMVMAAYEGTRIGRQELMGELLEDVDGALWVLARIDELRLETVDPRSLSRIVVGVDPAVSSGDDADETGIIVAARGPHDPATCQTHGCTAHGYVLADYTIPKAEHATTDQWAKRVVEAYDDFGADRVVAEGNQGHELVDSVLRTVRPGLSLHRVNASVGKRTRAEPVAALYEQGRVHHVGSGTQFVTLEEQLTSWTPDSGESPDRLDALVWALTELGLTTGVARLHVPTGRIPGW
jgi:phage terminase large subunit-like protein